MYGDFGVFGDFDVDVVFGDFCYFVDEVVVCDDFVVFCYGCEYVVVFFLMFYLWMDYDEV